MFFFNLIFALEQFKRENKYKGIVNTSNETTKEDKILCFEHFCSKRHLRFFPLKFKKLLEHEFDRFLKLEILFQQNCNQEIFKNYKNIFGSVEQLLYEFTAILLKIHLDDLYSSLVNFSKLKNYQNNAISKYFCCGVLEQKIKNLLKDKDLNIHQIIDQLVISNVDIKILKIYSRILKYMLFQKKIYHKEKKLTKKNIIKNTIYGNIKPKYSNKKFSIKKLENEVKIMLCKIGTHLITISWGLIEKFYDRHINYILNLYLD